MFLISLGLFVMSEAKQKSSYKVKFIRQEDRISELKMLLAYYKEITETIREPFIILDRSLTVVSANLAFYKMFKVRKKGTLGKLIYDLGNNQWDAPELRRLLENILPKHTIFNNYAVTHDFPGIGNKTMLLNARQVDSKQLILLAIEDVTAQWKLKIDSIEMTENLIKQRNKLQSLNNSKDEFISLASHQLRTPATTVKLYVGMLLEGYAGKLTKSQIDMLTKASDSNQQQLEIIEDLLRVAKIDDGKVYLEKTACDVYKQVQAVVRKQAIIFKKRRQSIVVNKPKKQVVAYIDNELMSMVLGNLLDNAGKYSLAGKQVSIDITKDNDYTIVAIKDDGVGIHKRDLHKLFKKFSRIDNALSVSVGGNGLGLYWAKKILDLHGGSIEVTSKQGVGSTFMVKTPIYTA